MRHPAGGSPAVGLRRDRAVSHQSRRIRSVGRPRLESTPRPRAAAAACDVEDHPKVATTERRLDSRTMPVEAFVHELEIVWQTLRQCRVRREWRRAWSTCGRSGPKPQSNRRESDARVHGTTRYLAASSARPVGHRRVPPKAGAPSTVFQQRPPQSQTKPASQRGLEPRYPAHRIDRRDCLARTTAAGAGGWGAASVGYD